MMVGWKGSGFLPAGATEIHLPISAFTCGMSIVLWVSTTGGQPPALPSLEKPQPAAADGSSHSNELADETSPYLLQHAENPVHWQAWSEKTLARAAREQKPIFLSVGYSSCHWCHVMERESFMDREIADFLNQHFICIKVDREERPDVDAIYMLAIQIITRRGGWPLSVFLTPAAKPFFGGTYFPARDGDRPGTAGFLTVIRRVHETWQKNQPGVQVTAEQVSRIIQTELSGAATASPISLDESLLERAQAELASQFDAQWGGFGFSADNPNVPKFPQAPVLFFLMERAKSGDTAALQMLTLTLDRIAQGGMRDQIGGGFHRYSVDRYWHIPHFEKMLYDNGQLASVFTAAYELTGKTEYADLLGEMFSFLIDEMTAPAGGFYSALDADSEGEEGKFYRWEKAEWAENLSKDEARLFEAVYAASPAGNFEGRYFVPLRLASWQELASAVELKAEELKAEELRRALVPIRAKLLEIRDRRKRPLTDTKIVTGWNGLMIRGLADAGQSLKQPKYVDAASKAARFLLDNLRDEQGRLRRTFSQGQARLNAYVDDYAFLANGLLALHRATGREEWLTSARQLMEKQDELFWDEQLGGYFFTSADHQQLIVRGKILSDNARPSGNAVSAENLLYVAQATGSPELREQARRTILAASRQLEETPTSAARTCYAVSLLLRDR